LSLLSVVVPNWAGQMIEGGSLHHPEWLKYVSWIEADSGDIGEVSTRGICFGYAESPKGSLGLRTGLKTIRELMEE